MLVMSPSDIVGPSPVTSNGTETTEIEDDPSEEVHQDDTSQVGSVRRSQVGIGGRPKTAVQRMLTYFEASYAHHEYTRPFSSALERRSCVSHPCA